jgi:hypothetical protein
LDSLEWLWRASSDLSLEEDGTPRLHSHRRSTRNATNTHASASTTNTTATSAKGIRYHLLSLEERALLATPYGAGTSYYELP